MRTYPITQQVLNRNRASIPGGVVSVNRSVQPEIVFSKADGQLLWDVDGNRYIDFHSAFAAHFLGHNDPCVSEAMQRVLSEKASLYGSGTTVLEGRLAELLCENIPCVESVQFVNSGSEATSQAIRVARAATGRDHIIVIQGGYNGWYNDVCCNLMTPLDQLGPRRCPGEYPFISISAGIPEDHQKLVHVVNFNDLPSVEYVCENYPVACLITEPVLQNIGLIAPRPGYLRGLRKLADRHGFVLVFDEIKTGFRHGIGGYAALAGVKPDLVTYGKALANGYPIAAIAGSRELMNYFVHPDPAKRVLLAGTYNAHPVPTAAAIATVERLLSSNGDGYSHVEELGRRMQTALERTFQKAGLSAVVARQGSAFCIYFMDHLPIDWHDLAANHDYATDQNLRQYLVENGIYFFPLPTKQCSISLAHTEADIEASLEHIKKGIFLVMDQGAESTLSNR